jgi:hypothetical protein
MTRNKRLMPAAHNTAMTGRRYSFANWTLILMLYSDSLLRADLRSTRTAHDEAEPRALET